MYRQLLKNNLALVAQYGASAMIPLLLMPHVAKSIGIDAYGRIAIFLALSVYPMLFVQYSFNLTGPAAIANGKNDERNVYFSILIAKLGLFLFAALLVLVWSAYELSKNYYLMSSITIMLAPALGSILNSSWYLQVKNHYVPLAVASIVASTVSVVIGFVLVRSGEEFVLEWAALSLIASGLIVGVITFVTALRKLPNKNKLLTLRPIDFLRNGGGIFASQFISMGYTSGGTVIIGMIANEGAAGRYAVLERVMNAVTGGALLLYTAAYPKLMTLYSSDMRKYKRLLMNLLHMYLLLTTIFACVILYFRVEVLAYLYGFAGSGGEIMLCLAAVWVMVSIVPAALTGYLTVRNSAYAILKITSLIFIVTFLIGVPCVKFFGAEGWLFGMVAAQTVNIIAGVYYWRISED